jgi:hypothetical protein
MALKPLFLLSTLVTLYACQSNLTASKDTTLNLNALSAANSIIPSEAGYLLLDLNTLPEEEDSPRQLVLYDSTGSFVDKIPLVGMVQSTGRKRITINRTLNGSLDNEKIGFLDIDYVELTHRSKGGGNFGTFLVDSLNYVPQTGRLDIYVKKPATQFVIVPTAFKLRENEFIEADTMSVFLKDVDFESDYAGNKYFTITTRVYNHRKGDPATVYFNHTYAYYYKDDNVLKKLHAMIIREFNKSSL